MYFTLRVIHAGEAGALAALPAPPLPISEEWAWMRGTIWRWPVNPSLATLIV